MKQFVLFDLNQPQALILEFVHNGFYGTAFARARIAVEQNIVAGVTRQQCLCIGDNQLALQLVA